MESTLVYIEVDISFVKIGRAGFPDFGFWVKSFNGQPRSIADAFAVGMDYEMSYTRLTTTKVQSYSFNEDTRTHIVRTKNSIYALQDYYNPKARKRAKAPLYMHSPIGRRFQEDNPDPDRHLLAYGRYRTKIYPADLPDWYVGGYMYKE